VTAAANPWTAYWESLPAGNLLFRPEAEAFARNFLDFFPPDPALRLLDFGCGYGHVAALLAPHFGGIAVADAAKSMQDAAAAALAGFENVTVWDHEWDRGFDLVLVNSVVQYLSAEELLDRLRQWRPILNPGGKVLLSDLIPPGHTARADAWALAKFSLRHRYFFQAVRKTLAERKRYAAVAHATPLFRIGREELTHLATTAGYRTTYLPHNLTHFPGREAAVLTPA
jgi:cyclopropane fatty-acyl-phospholipid synthase-like methyltransferase